MNATRTGAASALRDEMSSRQPRQDRSKASLERMINAAKELMLDRATDDFTLQEVADRGQVSIGSIYLRFGNKDGLIRGVVSQVLEDLAAGEIEMFSALRVECRSLAEFMPAYIEGYGEILRQLAPLLRLIMQRASHDPLVSAPGKEEALRAEQRAVDAMLVYKEEFGGGDHVDKAKAVYHMIFASLARHYSLGFQGEAAHGYDWPMLKRQFSVMAIAYMKSQ